MSEELDLFYYQVSCLEGKISEEKKQKLIGLIDEADRNNRLFNTLRRFGQGQTFQQNYLRISERLIRLINHYANIFPEDL